ncbi:hypothetical protein [Burkholderia phage BCSR5]|nr:hypothetical protein [Burkholderia phage BCSR5]
MYHIKYLLLKGVGPFKEARLDIKKGITTVYGLNKLGESSTNGNAAGKSFLTAAPAEIIYAEPMIGERKDRVTEGYRQLTMMDPKGRKLSVIREEKGKSDKLSFVVDGKTISPRTPKDQRDQLAKLFPLSQVDYSTYVHLDARKPHPLVMGTSAERKTFFTSFFPLAQIDARRKIFAAELQNLKKVKAAFNELSRIFKEQQEDLLPKEKRLKLKAKLKALEEKAERLQEAADKDRELVRLAQFGMSVRKDLEAFKKIAVDAGYDSVPDTDEFNKLLKDARVALKDDLATLEIAKEWKDYQRDTKQYQKAFDKLSDSAKALIETNSLKEARKAARAMEDILDEATAELKKVRLALSEAMDVKKPKKVAQPEGDQGELETLLRAYKHQLQHATKFKEGRCEHCGSVVKIKDVKKLKAKIADLEERIEQHEAYAEYKLDKRQYKEALTTINTLQEKESKLIQKVHKYKPCRGIYDELVNVPKQPKPYKGRKPDVDLTEKVVAYDREKLRVLEALQPHMETVRALLSMSEKDTERMCGLDLDASPYDRINKLRLKASEIETTLNLHQAAKQKCKDTKARLKKYEKQLKEERYLKMLVEAYSDKGVKKMAIEAISNQLMKLVNKYAKIVFPEDYRFSFHWEKTSVQLLVHRRYGKKVRVSDVRRLSGAESKLFTVVLVLALLAFVPPNKRVNLLIMDEPASNMSQETWESFSKLLPILNKLIPSIIIVTPKADERYKGAHEMTVIKVDGVARLVDGHPSTLGVKV